MSAEKATMQGASESPTQVIPKAYFDEEGVFTVDFPHTEQTSWSHVTRWTYTPSRGNCKIVHTPEVQGYLCRLMRALNKSPSVTLASLHNPEGKVIFVFRHDTLESAFNLILEFLDMRSRIFTFLHDVHIPLEDMKVSVQHGVISDPREQDVKAGKSICDWTSDYSPPCNAETNWVCKTDSTNILSEDEAHNSHFTLLKEDICRRFRALLRRVSTGSVIFTFHHGSTEDALGMISKHEEVRTMILECLQGIDPTVKDIQVEVQLQDLIDARSLPEHGDQDKRYEDKQEHDEVVQDLSEQVAALKQQLQETKEMEQAQLADLRMSMWMTKPGSPPPSDSGLGTATDTMTDVGDEEFHGITDLPELEGGHRQKGDASEPQHTSQTVTDLRKQLEDTRQELKATTERMHRLEIAQRKVTPTPARRDARADAALHDACRKGNLAEVKRILDTGRADVNSRGERSTTPVMAAAYAGHRDVVEFLVSRGADVSLVDGVGDNILHFACLGGDRKTVEFVLSLDGVDVNSRGERSWTPVMAAAWRGQRDVVEFLVSRGADVSLVDGVGYNILHWACVGGDRRTVEFVLSLDGVDVNARNNDGHTAADVARRRGHRQLSDFLVSRDTR